MNPPCLMSHVAMCIASSIPTKAVTLVVFHQGFVDGVLEVWRKIWSMPSHKKKSLCFFYLPGCSCSTFLKTTPELPEHQHLSYLNINTWVTWTSKNTVPVPGDVSRTTKELMVNEISQPTPTRASNSSTSSGSSLSTGSFDQLHSQSPKIHFEQSTIVDSYLISLCLYILNNYLIYNLYIYVYISTQITMLILYYITFIPSSLSRDHDAPGEVRKKPVLWAASAVGAREGPTFGTGSCGGREKHQNCKLQTKRSLLISLRQCATTARSNPSFFLSAGLLIFGSMIISWHVPCHGWQRYTPWPSQWSLFAATLSVEEPSSLPLPMASHPPSHSKADELHLLQREWGIKDSNLPLQIHLKTGPWKEQHLKTGPRKGQHLKTGPRTGPRKGPLHPWACLHSGRSSSSELALSGLRETCDVDLSSGPIDEQSLQNKLQAQLPHSVWLPCTSQNGLVRRLVEFCGERSSHRQGTPLRCHYVPRSVHQSHQPSASLLWDGSCFQGPSIGRKLLEMSPGHREIWYFHQLAQRALPWWQKTYQSHHHPLISQIGQFHSWGRRIRVSFLTPASVVAPSISSTEHCSERLDPAKYPWGLSEAEPASA